MGETGVKDKSLGFAKSVDHAVQKSDEECGIETHRARGIEQDDKPQRFDLAAAPGEFEERAAVRDIAMDSAAQIEPAAAAANLSAADQPRAHHPGKPRRERV